MLTITHTPPMAQAVGLLIIFMAVSNVLSAFQLQCTASPTARFMNKVDLLIAGAASALGAGIVLNAISKNPKMLVGVGSGVLLVQSVVALAAQSTDPDCQRSTLADLATAAVLLLSLAGAASSVVAAR